MRGYECGDRQHIHVQRIPLNIEGRSDACTRTRCAPREAIRSPAHACKYIRVRICTEARQVLLYAARSRKKRPTLATREEVSSVGRLRRNKKQQRGSNAYARTVALNWLVYSQGMRVQEKKPSRRKGIYTTTPHVSYFREIKSYTKTLRFNDFIRKVASFVGKYNLPLDRATKSKSLSSIHTRPRRRSRSNSSSRAQRLVFCSFSELLRTSARALSKGRDDACDDGEALYNAIFSLVYKGGSTATAQCDSSITRIACSVCARVYLKHTEEETQKTREARSSSHSSRCIIYRTHTHTQSRDGSEEVPIFEFGTFKFLFVEKKKCICVSVYRIRVTNMYTDRVKCTPTTRGLYKYIVFSSVNEVARSTHILLLHLITS
uniref:Uncharacterized protein n=1 Tax=Trichogramma kaykai TaxID=54128 RepID=A0ABD2WL52_9HYME